MGWRPPLGAPVVESGDPADPDHRDHPKTCAFTVTPELWRALRVRARREETSVSRVIRSILDKELRPHRVQEPSKPLNEALDRREAAGVAKVLRAGPNA